MHLMMVRMRMIMNMNILNLQHHHLDNCDDHHNFLMVLSSAWFRFIQKIPGAPGPATDPFFRTFLYRNASDRTPQCRKWIFLTIYLLGDVRSCPCVNPTVLKKYTGTFSFSGLNIEVNPSSNHLWGTDLHLWGKDVPSNN